MRGKARGRLVIINNFQFGQEVDVERMNRSQQDATSLDVLFKQLHFQTKQHSNLTLKVCYSESHFSKQQLVELSIKFDRSRNIQHLILRFSNTYPALSIIFIKYNR